MIFRHFLTDNNESNAFIVACGQTRRALLVDAGAFDRSMADFIALHGLVPAQVFITHDHYDHTGALQEIVRRHAPEILSGAGLAGGLKTRVAGHGDEVRVGALAGRVLSVPGHTPDGVCLVFPGMVFTGDALFAGSIGGTATPALSEQLKEGIRKHIFTLPPHYEVHTGHGPSSTVAVESRHNPFFV